LNRLLEDINRQFGFIDLFSGAGGMSTGFLRHGAFRPLFAVDVQAGKPSSGHGSLECNATYEANIGIPVREADLSMYEPEELLNDARIRTGELDVLISCAPCTGFSRTLGRNHLEDDPRNHLVERTGYFVECLRPKILIMENVRELVHGNFSIHAENLRRHLNRIGYSFHASVHVLTEFGLPQTRERAIIIATRDGLPIHTLGELWQGHCVPRAATTVRHAISHLPAVSAGQVHPSDPMHVSPSFSREDSLGRLKAIPHDGGSWADILGLPEADRLLTPRMKQYAEQGDMGSHPDVYGRLWWDRPCVTIKRECSHVGNGRYSHPVQDRLCTVRELALLNGFPKNYVFKGSLSNRYRQIGDAVPPLVSFQIAHLCNWMLTGEKPSLSDALLEGTSVEGVEVMRAPIRRELFPEAGCTA